MMTTTNPNTAFKTTDNTHRHNHTILHHIGRRLLLLTTLLAMAVGVKAQTYTMPTISNAPTDGNWANNVAWHHVRTNNGYYLVSNSTDGSGNLYLNSTERPTGAAGLWCVVGNSTDGYTLYNKAIGASTPLGMTGYTNDGGARAKFVAVGTANYATSFDFVQSTGRENHWAIHVHGSNSYYWNRRAPYLSNWNSNGATNDNGSAFLFTEIADLASVADITAAKNELKEGVGYPKTTSTAYQALNALDPNTTTISKTDLSTLVTAYKTSTDIQLPEDSKTDGKAYQFAFTANDGNNTPYYIVANGNTLSVSATGPGSTFYCKKFTNVNGEERFAFISEEGKLMSFRTLTDIYTATENLCNDFTVGPMVGVTSNVTSTKEQRFGSVYLTTSARSTTDATLGCFVYKFTDTKGWDASSAPFHNGNYTSAIKVTEVTSYTANDAQQLASAKIEAKVSVLGRKIPGAEVCQYTYTVNGQPSTDSNTIIAAIENAATAAAVNAINNSATINQPKAGRYYRIKAYVSQKFIDAANGSSTTSAMAMRSYGNHDEQGTIFRLDADNDNVLLFNLGTGSYVYDTYKIGANNANQANTWTFKESTRTPGCFTLTSNEATNMELHDGGDYASGCATICGASHDFILEETELPTTPAPKFVPNADFTKFTLTCTSNHGNIFYTTNGDDPTVPGVSAQTLSVGDSKIFEAVDVANVKAYAKKGAIPASPVVGVVAVNTADDLKNMTGSSYYYLATDGITASSHTSIAEFKGTFEGRFFTINGLKTPLFASADGAIIKNVVLKDVSITGGTGNVGAIVGTAQGKTRIYNCGVLSGEVGGGTNVGGIAGRIEDAARVINCYSFAKISGGNTVGGIVGNNTIASNAGNLQTLVMNCMYYGDITGGTSVSPIYGGAKISNHGAEGDANGINNYNYYRYEADITPTVYNCALAAEERYLKRFEFYRHVLNSQRKLCAFYVTGSVDNYEEIAKWVLDVSDPDAPKYPILKPWGKYASMMNRATTNKSGNKLTVTISGKNATEEAISATTKLDITNADPTTYDYNHYKVQLPYYNEFFDDNYTNNKVVTGWKITSITGGTEGTFSKEGNNRYNFADRHCTQKDLYKESGRVFAQGGYFNVPEGVKAITIEPYWGKAIYLSDSYHDVVYNNGTGHGFTPAGEASDTYNTQTQTVYNTLSTARAQLTSSAQSVYDNAIVLVGNYHSFDETWHNGTTPFTVMSVDENRDNEPDYSLYCRTSGRLNVNPIRFDFLNHVAIGMAAKEDGRSEMYNLAIWEMTGWFEITETALAIYEEFEYDASAANKAAAPLILNGGIIKQFGSTAFNYHAIEKTPYTIVGGNCYLYNYAPGCNTNTSTPIKTKFPPVSILGGEYEQFYLSGGNPAPTPYADYNALCYGNGGKIGTFAGAYQEAIDGDVIIKLDHMLVDEFYGGGVNDKNPITGNINVTINNSQVGTYCGGPKFGNMQKVIEDGQTKTKTITTYAENTTFGQFFGAGYGGTSLFRGSNADAGRDPYPTDWLNTYFISRKGKYYDGSQQLEGRFNPNGILVGYETEFFSYAGGGSRNSRFYTDYASLSVAEVGDVTSTLKGCTVLGDLYGGGNLGKAVGNLTTTLEDCTVKGNVYAAGFSAAVPTCEVMKTDTPEYSTYNTNTGIFTPAMYPEPETYTWAQATKALEHGEKYIDETKKEIYTYAVDLSDLGTVRGQTTIVIKGDRSVIGDAEAGTGGSVFGGGNASKVIGNTHVYIQGGTINGSVFGAGNQAEVTGKTEVVIGE